MDGEIRRHERDIIEYPENYEDMKKKYIEREESRLKIVLARNKAESAQELENIASKAIVKRSLRVASDHKQLKDRTVISEAKSEEIQYLKKQLSEEISAIGKRVLQEQSYEGSSQEEKVSQRQQLHGRVSQNAPLKEGQGTSGKF